MSVTISGTNITYNDSTTQSSTATYVSAAQYTAYNGGTWVVGTNAFPTSDTAYPLNVYGNANLPASTSIFCNYVAYRSSTRDDPARGLDGRIDSGYMYARVIYRTNSI